MGMFRYENMSRLQEISIFLFLEANHRTLYKDFKFLANYLRDFLEISSKPLAIFLKKQVVGFLDLW